MRFFFELCKACIEDTCDIRGGCAFNTGRTSDSEVLYSNLEDARSEVVALADRNFGDSTPFMRIRCVTQTNIRTGKRLGLKQAILPACVNLAYSAKRNQQDGKEANSLRLARRTKVNWLLLCNIIDTNLKGAIGALGKGWSPIGILSINHKSFLTSSN